jgi:hypothetical protein
MTTIHDILNAAYKTSADADGLAELASLMGVFAPPHTFNESTWDRFRGNTEVTLLASAARTADTASADQTNYNHRGAIIWVDVTARAGSTTMTPYVQVKDPATDQYNTGWGGSAIDTADGTRVYYFYPGASTTASFSDETCLAFPRTWRFFLDHSDTDSITYSVGAAMII